jgi:hypothetical protein
VVDLGGWIGTVETLIMQAPGACAFTCLSMLPLSVAAQTSDSTVQIDHHHRSITVFDVPADISMSQLQEEMLADRRINSVTPWAWRAAATTQSPGAKWL